MLKSVLLTLAIASFTRSRCFSRFYPPGECATKPSFLWPATYAEVASHALHAPPRHMEPWCLGHAGGSRLLCAAVQAEEWVAAVQRDRSDLTASSSRVVVEAVLAGLAGDDSGGTGYSRNLARGYRK